MAILTSERLDAAQETNTRAWRGVAAAIVAIAWGGNEFTPLLVMYKGNGLPLTAVDLLLFYYVLGIVPALLIGGPLSDRWGRRPLMLPAPLIAAAGSLLLAVGAMVWFNASIQDWWGSDGFGGRRFDGIIPIAAIGLATALDTLRRWTMARSLAAMAERRRFASAAADGGGD